MSVKRCDAAVYLLSVWTATHVVESVVFLQDDCIFNYIIDISCCASVFVCMS